MYGVSDARSIGFSMPDNMHCVHELLLRQKWERRAQLLNVSLWKYVAKSSSPKDLTLHNPHSLNLV